jgi:cyclic pyranopterin monophosphate synthase
MSQSVPKLTHLDSKGNARMVDVGEKSATRRTAIASGRIRVLPSTIHAIANDTTPKGDVLAVARVAGIMAAKKTADLIPLCHPLILDSVEVDFDFPQLDPSHADPVDLVVKAVVSLIGKTGVEMEALTAVSVAALTVYDMCKAIDKQMLIHDIKLVSKTK